MEDNLSSHLDGLKVTWVFQGFGPHFPHAKSTFSFRPAPGFLLSKTLSRLLGTWLCIISLSLHFWSRDLGTPALYLEVWSLHDSFTELSLQ